MELSKKATKKTFSVPTVKNVLGDEKQVESEELKHKVKKSKVNPAAGDAQEKKKSKKKSKTGDCSNEKPAEPKSVNCLLQEKKPAKKRTTLDSKKNVRSLTEAEYADIFAAVINLDDDKGCEDENAKEDVENVEDSIYTAATQIDPTNEKDANTSSANPIQEHEQEELLPSDTVRANKEIAGMKEVSEELSQTDLQSGEIIKDELSQDAFETENPKKTSKKKKTFLETNKSKDACPEPEVSHEKILPCDELTPNQGTPSADGNIEPGHQDLPNTESKIEKLSLDNEKKNKKKKKVSKKSEKESEHTEADSTVNVSGTREEHEDSNRCEKETSHKESETTNNASEELCGQILSQAEVEPEEKGKEKKAKKKKKKRMETHEEQNGETPEHHSPVDDERKNVTNKEKKKEDRDLSLKKKKRSGKPFEIPVALGEEDVLGTKKESNSEKMDTKDPLEKKEKKLKKKKQLLKPEQPEDQKLDLVAKKKNKHATRKLGFDTGTTSKKLQATKDETEATEIPAETGTWVQCCQKACKKWRYLPDVQDPAMVDVRWVCSMHPDPRYCSCDMPEQDYDESDHILTPFTLGSLVWAKMDGFPWWPALVDADPDHEIYCEVPDEHCMVPSDYHVVFLDPTVSRSWIRKERIRPMSTPDLTPGLNYLKGHKYKKEISVAMRKAELALAMPLQERLNTFGFAACFRNERSKWTKAPEKKKPSTQKKGKKMFKQPKNDSLPKPSKIKIQKRLQRPESSDEDSLSDVSLKDSSEFSSPGGSQSSDEDARNGSARRLKKCSKRSKSRHRKPQKESGMFPDSSSDRSNESVSKPRQALPQATQKRSHLSPLARRQVKKKRKERDSLRQGFQQKLGADGKGDGVKPKFGAQKVANKRPKFEKDTTGPTKKLKKQKFFIPLTTAKPDTDQTLEKVTKDAPLVSGENFASRRDKSIEESEPEDGSEHGIAPKKIGSLEDKSGKTGILPAVTANQSSSSQCTLHSDKENTPPADEPAKTKRFKSEKTKKRDLDRKEEEDKLETRGQKTEPVKFMQSEEVSASRNKLKLKKQNFVAPAKTEENSPLNQLVETSTPSDKQKEGNKSPPKKHSAKKQTVKDALEEQVPPKLEDSDESGSPLLSPGNKDQFVPSLEASDSFDHLDVDMISQHEEALKPVSAKAQGKAESDSDCLDIQESLPLPSLQQVLVVKGKGCSDRDSSAMSDPLEMAED